jgi:hypothetical protein
MPTLFSLEERQIEALHAVVVLPDHVNDIAGAFAAGRA